MVIVVIVGVLFFLFHHTHCVITDSRDPKSTIRQALPAFPKQLLQLLQWLGGYIALDPMLFTSLCRVLASHPTDPLAEALLATCVLPGLALLPDNTAAVAEAWAVVQPLHYTARFRLYAGWQRTLREEPVLRASQRLAVAEAKRVLRRIHIPEDKKERREVLRPFGRRLGKVRG